MSDIVNELLSRASDEDGIGWTPTTIIPVPARLLHHAADRIEQLEAEAKTRTLDYLGQVGQLSEEITRLRAAMTEAASLASSGAPYINNTIYAVLWAALENRT